MRLVYPVTRKITSPYFAPILIVVAVIFTVLVTLVSVVTVGYEDVTGDAIPFNSTIPMWYDSIMPKTTVWAPKTSKCQGSVMKVDDGLQTSTNAFWSWKLQKFIDPGENRIDGMIYSNNTLQNCSVGNLRLTQPVSGPAGGAVSNINQFKTNEVG
jgi:hypothetical protein